jgi:hypothetical protein
VPTYSRDTLLWRAAAALGIGRAFGECVSGDVGPVMMPCRALPQHAIVIGSLHPRFGIALAVFDVLGVRRFAHDREALCLHLISKAPFASFVSHLMNCLLV